MGIRLPQPHRGQRRVREEMRRINVLSAGRRWRKTTMAMTIAVENALDGKPVMWGAPTFSQVNVAWEETWRAASGVAEFNRTRMTVNFPATGGRRDGGQIIFRSLDNPENARGHTAAYIIVDEAGDVQQVAWYEVLRPMLMDTQGGALLIGTPKGRNWFWREWVAAQSRPDSKAWQIPTLGCRVENGVLIREPHPYENPAVDFAEIQNMFNTMPESSFRQEVLAEFLENEGAVFRNIQACLNAPESKPEDHAGHRIICGVDWAKQNDWTCISVICQDCGQELELDRFNQIDYAFQRGRLQALVEKWGISHIEAEANSMGEPVIEELQRAGLPVVPFHTTSTSKMPLIENLALGLEKVECQWLDIPVATLELEAYERTVTRTGRSQYSAPEGLNDDTVIARALAFRAAFSRVEYSKPGIVSYV